MTSIKKIEIFRPTQELIFGSHDYWLVKSRQEHKSFVVGAYEDAKSGIYYKYRKKEIYEFFSEKNLEIGSWLYLFEKAGKLVFGYDTHNVNGNNIPDAILDAIRFRPEYNMIFRLIGKENGCLTFRLVCCNGKIV